MLPAPNEAYPLSADAVRCFLRDGQRRLDPGRRVDRDVWLRGCEPGERAAGPRNPVLWRRAA